MKKALSILLMLALMMAALAACGGQAEEEDEAEFVEEPEVSEEVDDVDDLFYGDYYVEFFQSGPLLLADDVKNGMGMGAMDSSGEFVIPCKYDELFYIGRDRYLALVGQAVEAYKYGIVDLEGNEIVPCEYDYIGPADTPVDDYYYMYRINYFLDGYVEPSGEYLLAKKGGQPDEYISVLDGHTVAEASKSEQITFDDSLTEEYDSGTEIPVPEAISNNYEVAWAIMYGSAECWGYKNAQYHYYGVKDADGYTVLDLNGNEIAPGTRWVDVGPEYGNGLIAVRAEEEGPWAFIDSEGNLVTEYIFEVVQDNA